jgi:farnesyl diphosphate synthase
MATKTARPDFEQIFPSLVQDLLGEAKKFNVPDNALQWFEKVGSCGLCK